VKGARSRDNIPLGEEIRAEEIVKRAGGTVTIIPLEPGYSRASLMARIRQAGA
jgi:bifunctional ADP-heptose synthase (sugar kinase/adenylyltransferase)